MAAGPDPHSFSAPPTAAPELGDFTQFTPFEVPAGSGAARAYCGFIRPFSDDGTSVRVMRAIEHNRPVTVTGGRLDADHPDLPTHILEPYLTEMTTPFTVLVLAFDGLQRPRTYLIKPPMIPRLSACGHLRRDKTITIGGDEFPALCVYSGALLVFHDDQSPVERVLDQTATYLGKYLIWLRTRSLYRQTPDGPKLVRKRRPGEALSQAELNRSQDLFWNGYWPGPSAPSGPAAHLATIKADRECWCWSGDRYGACCRPKELRIIEEINREYACARFVSRLMAAVHAKLRS
jgi:hypothetical protein